MIRGEAAGVTRDELIAGRGSSSTRASGCSADPSLGSLQIWLQRSDDLLATAWGSMDRYHLAWLMVGKPKDIVRGRAMTPDEEAAYVREVAEQKTAALRMSLDAVERQGMPFVGETGGSGGRPDRGAPVDRAPDRPACRRPGCRAPRRGRRRPRSISTTTRPRPAPGPDAAMTSRRRRSRVGGATVPRPTRRARLPPARRSGSTSTSRASSTATSDRPTSRRRSTWSSCGPPARLRDDAAALRGAPRRPRSTSPTGAPGSTPSSSPSRRRRAALAGEPLPYLEHVARCFAYARRAAPTPSSRRPPRGSTSCCPGDGPLADRLAAWDARFEIAVERLPRVVELARRAVPGARGGRSSACPTARTCASRSSTGQPWSGYNWFDGGRRSRVDINTDLPVRAPDLIARVAHETYPGPPPRARLEGGGPGRRRGPARGVDPAHQHPRVPDQRGPGRPRACVRGPRRRRASTCWSRSFERAGPGDRGRPGRGPRRCRTVARADARAGVRWPRSAATPRSCATPTAGPTTRSATTCATSAGIPPAAAEKRLEFIEHPLWRTYVFVYAEGEALLRRWLDAGPEPRARGAVRAAAPRAADAGRVVRSRSRLNDDPIVAVAVVVGVGRRAVQVSACRGRRRARSPSRGGTRPRSGCPAR